jgi:polyisoprenoid-binding protein YceI
VKIAAAILAIALAASALHAEGHKYTVRAEGKNVASFILNDPFEEVNGDTKGTTGTIIADPANIAASSVELSVDLATIDTGVKLRDEHIRGEFAEVARFPHATFKSVSVSGSSSAAANQAVEIGVTGDFQLHGVTRRLTVPMRVVLVPETELTRSQRGPGDWLHASGKFSIKLSEFGIHVPQSFVDDKIEITLDLFAVSPH